MTTLLEPNVQSSTGGQPLSSSDHAALDKVTNNATLRRHVLSIKLWDPTGTIVHATNNELVGQNFGADDLARVLSGWTASHFDNFSEQENIFGREFHGPIFEIYVPLRSRVNGSIIAIGEFYEDATRIRSEMFKLLRKDWAILTLCGLAIFAGLFAVFRQGSRTIESQKEALLHIQQDRTALLDGMAQFRAGLETARGQLQDMDEKRSRRIGQELHDGPVQMLGYLSLAPGQSCSDWQLWRRTIERRGRHAGNHGSHSGGVAADLQKVAGIGLWTDGCIGRHRRGLGKAQHFRNRDGWFATDRPAASAGPPRRVANRGRDVAQWLSIR